MQYNILIDRQLLDIIECYGSINDVAERILTHWENGDIDILNKPAVGQRGQTLRRTINIYNKDYNDLVNIRGAKCPEISLVRVLYWFFEEDMPELLGWIPIKKYIDNNKAKYMKALDAAITEVKKAIKLNENSQLISILSDLEELLYACDNKCS